MKSPPVDIYDEDVRPAEASKHIPCARHWLTEMRAKVRRIDDYPELQEAITNLEMSLKYPDRGDERHALKASVAL